MKRITMVIALGFGIFGTHALLHHPPTASSEQSVPTGDARIVSSAALDRYDVEIVYSGTSLSTTTVSLSKGTRVRFTNDSDELFWPASGVHPTHTLYPEKNDADCLGSSFDACRGLGKGESFDFTFNYPGTWTFHDHLHAYNAGRIIVSE